MRLPNDYRHLLRVGGSTIWAAVGIPVLISELLAPTNARDWIPLLAWAASFSLFGAAFLLATRHGRGNSDRAGAVGLVAGQSAAVISLLALPTCFGLEAALLVLVALELGALFSRRIAAAWITAQSAGFCAIMWAQWGWHWAVVLTFAYLAFQLVADATTRLFVEEASARDRLTTANAELEATRELLAQSSRIAERARIARDLHDVLGHHLTALSLNLEVAIHLTDGDARVRVETAQSVTKLLLGDVRAVVGELRQEKGLDLSSALEKLAAGIPRLQIHVEVAPGFSVDDPVAGEIVLRCAQEIVTNTVRHAQAENLWIGVTRNASGIEIRARDDGRGADAVRSGGGLSGMRDRFERRGGGLSVVTAEGRGFSITASLPLPGAPS
jgi:signal transduction histidine kinase